MKKLLISTLITLSTLSAFAQSSVIGTGTASSNIPPQCDDASFASARQAADLNAAKQCQGQAERTSDYQNECSVYVHGYAARAIVSAQYTCNAI